MRSLSYLGRRIPGRSPLSPENGYSDPGKRVQRPVELLFRRTEHGVQGWMFTHPAVVAG